MAKDKTRPADRPARPPRARRRQRRWIIGVAAAIIVAVVVGYLGYQAGADRPGVEMPDQGTLHIQTESQPHVPYNSDPPTSGPHLPYLAPWGVHTSPIAKELQVHNLEDGGVMVQYNCPDACLDLVAKLTAIVSGYDRQVILAP